MAERLITLLLVALLFAAPAWAKEAAPVASNPELEARMMVLATELRCLVCQNQTIADSHAELAIDLRNQVIAQVRAGNHAGQHHPPQSSHSIP